MQDRYAGDIGDFGKFGLLKALLSEGFSLGVNWYKAEPPESTTAFIGLSAVNGERRGVSRDAGPPPLISTPAIPPFSQRMTVTPVMAS